MRVPAFPRLIPFPCVIARAYPAPKCIPLGPHPAPTPVIARSLRRGNLGWGGVRYVGFGERGLNGSSDHPPGPLPSRKGAEIKISGGHPQTPAKEAVPLWTPPSRRGAPRGYPQAWSRHHCLVCTERVQPVDGSTTALVRLASSFHPYCTRRRYARHHAGRGRHRWHR